jgi:integrase
MICERTTGSLFITASGARLDRVSAWRILRKLAGASLRDVQDAAGHADPRTTRRYDRARHNLDRHPTYQLAGMID